MNKETIKRALYLRNLLEGKKWKNGQLVTIDNVVYRVTKYNMNPTISYLVGHGKCAGCGKNNEIVICDRDCRLAEYAPKDIIGRMLICHANVPYDCCLKRIQYGEKS